MICGDVDQLLDAFVDSELPPPMLLEVARHAAACSTCETAIRQLETLRRTLADTVHADVAALDLSGIWPRVSAEVHRANARRTWQRRVRTLPAWGAVLAVAASAVFWLRVPAQETATSRPVVAHVATRTPQNLAYIDRLAGKDVSIRREPKAGTTLIWVNYNPGDGPR
jgi:anti-sigma factor RsiW